MTFKTLAAALLFAAVSAAPAVAYDNFIPLGTGYSTHKSSMAQLGSSEDQVSNQTDLFETEIYRAQEAERDHDNYVRRFVSNPEATGSDQFIDY